MYVILFYDFRRSCPSQQNAQKQQTNGGGNNNGNIRTSNNNKKHAKPYFNLVNLIQLSRKKDDDILTAIAQRKNEFEELLRNSEKFILNTQDMFVVTLQILTNVCRANFTEILTSVLSTACSTNFLRSLEAYITKLAFENPTGKGTNKLYHDDRDKFWSNIIEFFRKIHQLLPLKARDELMSILNIIDQVSETISKNQNYKIDEKVKIAASNMYKELEEEIRNFERNKAVIDSKEEDSEVDPPENFRLLRTIPTLQDLADREPFIRPCKIKDAYNSVEHYLDVQFRVVREDFICPLRTGLEEYLHEPQKYRNSDLRIYKKVTMLAPETIKNNVGIKIFFGKIKNINWHRSKRFMYGGLLLFSSDNFQTGFFATVADSNPRDLMNGFMFIEPCEGTIISHDMYTRSFTVLESKIYFEPYLAVLNALKNINDQNFPMTNYLIHADTSVKLPQYLVGKQMLTYKGFNLPLEPNHPWPTAKELSFDESQYNAFKSALTNEFSVIQGPPGTGKTFIALELVRTLLENDSNWKEHGPIIVVCLTNHALDQFLEGSLEHTKSVVRMGGRSKSETLAPYTLMERRKKFHNRGVPGNSLMYQKKHELEDILRQIEEVRIFINYLKCSNAIVPLHCLTDYCEDMILHRFGSSEELVNWLIGFKTNFVTEKPTEVLIEENPIEEDYEHDVYMDNDLELTYKLRIHNNSGLIFPLRRMDELIAKLYQQMNDYNNSEIHCHPFDPLFYQFLEWEEDFHKLRAVQFSLRV